MLTKSFLYCKKPVWINNRSGIHYRIPLTVQSRIYEPDSLAQRLRSVYGCIVTARDFSATKKTVSKRTTLNTSIIQRLQTDQRNIAYGRRNAVNFEQNCYSAWDIVRQPAHFIQSRRQNTGGTDFFSYPNLLGL